MIRHIYRMEDVLNSCVAFGSFDGMHKGHLAVVDQVVAAANSRNLRSVIISTYSSARAKSEKVLTTESEKLYFMEKAGVNEMVTYNLDKEELDREMFIRQVVIEKTRARIIVTSEEDTELELLKRVAAEAEVNVIVIPAVWHEGRIITKMMIRDAFEQCRFEDVYAMCGHPYVMLGVVERGKALGRTVGMPTANLGVPEEKLKPPSGVYATLSELEDGVYKGLTNIGTRPSVDDLDHITIETFILNFDRDIYGQSVLLEVHLYIRGVTKFENLQEVQNQVQKDVERVRGYLNSTERMAI